MTAPTFPAILADPPWSYATWSAKGLGKSAEQHYDTMSLDAIKALPVAGMAARDAVLFLWATRTHLDKAFEVIDAWGFAYKSIAFVWVKTENGRPHYGMGHWTRANTEPCLLATRGKPKRLNAGVEELIYGEIGDHSAKPYEQYRRIEKLVAGPYLELFAQLRVPGWAGWGNRVGARGGFGGAVVDLPGLPARAVTPPQPELFGDSPFGEVPA
jgi:N6-adenosine-specific RNA methylase IME4